MKIDCRQLFEIVGEQVNITSQLNLEDLTLGMAHPFTEPVRLNGSISNRAGIVTLSYTASAVFHALCDRCLGPVDTPVVYEFQHILVKQVSDDDNDDFIVVPDMVLDLDGLAASDVALELPGKVLCKEDCKGLCPICGCDKNKQACSCKQHYVDPRLAKLSKLLEDD